MRKMICFVSSLFLITSLVAQSKAVLKLNLEPGSSYQLDVRLQRNYYPDPSQPELPEKDFRYPRLQKINVRYKLNVLERAEDGYKVELVRAFLRNYSSRAQFAIQVNSFRTGKKIITDPIGQDTVQFEMDYFGKLIRQANPDSTRTAYVLPDDYRIETTVAMPELIQSFTALFSYLHPQEVSIGSSWVTPDGIHFTVVKEQAGFWHLHTNDGRDFYLDPATNWLRFMEHHEQLQRDPKKPKDVFMDMEQIVQGQINAGQIVTQINGTAPTHKNGSFWLRITPYFQGADAEYLVPVDENGHFSWQDTLRQGSFFQLTDLGETTFWGYMRPGGNLRLSLQNQQNWNIEGNTKEECVYLNQFFKSFPRYRQLLEISPFVEGKYEADLEQFWLDQVEESKLAKQQLSALADRLDPEFKALQNRQIDYFRAGLLNLNLSFHYTYQFRLEPDLQEIPEFYKNFLEDQVLYDELGNALPAFRALFHLHLQQKMFAAASGNIGKLLFQPYEPLYYFAQLQYQSYPQYQTGFDLLQNVINKSNSTAQVDHLYQHFQKVFVAGDLNQKLEESYRKMQALQAPGATFPDLLLYDDVGKPVNLQSLKGTPSVLVVVHGQNFWDKILMMETTPGLFPGVQFVFLHIDSQSEGPITQGENIRHWYARTNSPAVANTFRQFTKGKHPRAYLLDRTGKLSGTLIGSEHYSEELLPTLQNLEAGTPLLDKQSRQNILLILLGLIGGGLIIGLITLVWQGRLRRRELAKRQQVETQLQAIRSQLNPHFMFNSMSSIQHLIRSGQSDQAQSYLGKLASLLRTSLRHNREHFISLQEELDIVGQYCELEALRFNFSYNLEIDQQLDTRAISIPPLLLQPYVENAVLHGISSLRERGKLLVQISEQGRQLWIRIRDNGQGLKSSRSSPHRGNGIGLALNAERLKLVYGNAAQVNIYSPSPTNGQDLGSGTEVQIAMPMDV